MELWDLYNRDGGRLNRTVVRGKKMQPGEYHLVVGVWVCNSRGQVLLTLRAPNKETYPNYWENTGGSVVAGESSIQGALRELWEETGIQAAAEELTFLKRVVEKRTIVDQYRLIKDIEVNQLQFQPGETQDARWVTWDELLLAVKQGEIAQPIAQRLIAIQPMLQG